MHQDTVLGIFWVSMVGFYCIVSRQFVSRACVSFDMCMDTKFSTTSVQSVLYIASTYLILVCFTDYQELVCQILLVCDSALGIFFRLCLINEYCSVSSFEVNIFLVRRYLIYLQPLFKISQIITCPVKWSSTDNS